MDFPDFSLDTSLLEGAKKPEQGETYDVIIIGGGPAAMTAAVYASRKMMNLAIITKDFGGQVRETSEIENWIGFQNINAKDLADSFEDHVKSFDVPVCLNCDVAEIKKEDNIFRIITDNGQGYSGHSVIFATGKRHRPLGIPGEKELVGRGLAYCATCDAPFYKGKKVVIAGGGNSAFTTAMDLLKVGAEITIVNFIKGWQADASLQERIRSSGKVTFLDYYQFVRVEGKNQVTGVVLRNRDSGEEKEVIAEGVFVEIGLLPNSNPVKNLAELNKQGEVVVDCSCRTNVDGLFGAGDVTTVAHKQIVISAGEGAKAALSAYNYLVEKTLI